MAAGVIGTGAYLPDPVLDNETLAARLGQSPDWIMERTGIRERRIAPPGQNCSDLAVAAARQALAQAACAPQDINAIIVATSSGDFRSPATAVLVQAALDIPSALCFDLSAACCGFVYGVTVACGLVDAGLCGKALVIGAELTSRLVDSADLNTAILFGDGAGAVVIGPLPEGYGLLATDAGTTGTEYAVAHIPGGGSRLPLTPAGLAEGVQFMRMDGVLLFMFAMRALGDAILRVLAKAALTPAHVDLFVPHQANRRIIEAAADRLQLPLDKMMLNLEQYGNTSAASIPIALHDAIGQGRLRPGHRVVLAGFGAGLSWGALVMRWHAAGPKPSLQQGDE
ncbi:MAG: 3-oxoacyl-ACP synthase [Desulfobulbaceae bacterium A2]|nr:MAG: 3-oxoacyl-ACP synthase [Desulfobulbaceae bacterium A2]